MEMDKHRNSFNRPTGGAMFNRFGITMDYFILLFFFFFFFYLAFPFISFFLCLNQEEKRKTKIK